MKYTISERNWGIQAGNAIALVKDGDEIVVPNKTVEKFVKSLMTHNRPDANVTITLQEDNHDG